MDAFTQRVELQDDDEDALQLRSPLQPSTGDADAGDVDDNGAHTALDDDQVVPGQEDHLETVTRRRRPFYEGTSGPFPNAEVSELCPRTSVAC